MRSSVATLLVLVWALLTSHDPDAPPADWKVVDRFPTAGSCDHVRDAAADEAALRAIGALALTEPQNPLRMRAWERALRRADRQFRCERR